ncbi:MAG: ATP-grasp domain-containing protein [Cytophagales bacterium]|nr:ATP-grasp domain-containing protein [Cytophagales bacterium]
MKESLKLGTPLTSSAVKVMMLGSGELGKEVVIEFQRYGVEVIAVDRYDNAPAMQVAHRSYTISMLDGNALRQVIERERPHYIVPEVEAIATDTLVELENEGFNIIPTAQAARLTMNREGIRLLATDKLKIKTSPFCFSNTRLDFETSVRRIGFPCVVKPIMSSSGKGQSVVKSPEDIDHAWEYSQHGGRTGGAK